MKFKLTAASGLVLAHKEFLPIEKISNIKEKTFLWENQPYESTADIEIDSLEELLELAKRLNCGVIVYPDPKPEIMLYDDYLD